MLAEIPGKILIIYLMFMMLLQHKLDDAYQVNYSICASVPHLLHMFFYLFSALKDQLPHQAQYKEIQLLTWLDTR